MKKSLKITLIILTILIAGFFIVYFSLKYSADTANAPAILELSPKDDTNEIDLFKELTIKFNKDVNAADFSLSSSENIAFLNESKKDNLKLSTRGSLLILDEPHKFLANKNYTLTITSNNYFSVNRKKTKSLLWSFQTNISDEEIANQESEWQNIAKNQTTRAAQPLDKYLENGIYQTEHFRLEPSGAGGYSIMLFVPFDSEKYAANDENTKTTYYNSLKAYKTEALDWIKSKNVDPASLKLAWVPQEANEI